MKKMFYSLFLKTWLHVLGVALFAITVSLAHADERKLDAPLRELDFRDTTISEAVRLLSDLTNVNVITTPKAGKKSFTLFLRNTSLRNAIDSMCRVNGLWYRYNKDSEVFLIMTGAEYKRDVVVFRKEHTRTFQLQHQNVSRAANTIAALFGKRVTVIAPKLDGGYQFDRELQNEGNNQGASIRRSRGNGNVTGSDGTKGAVEEIGDVTIEQLVKAQGSALESAMKGINALSGVVTDDQLESVASQAKATIYVTYNRLHNLLVVRTSDELALEDIDSLIKELDRPATQVLLEMKILQVNLGSGSEFAMDLDYAGQGVTDGNGSEQGGNILNSSSTLADIPAAALGLGNYALEGGTMIFQAMNDRIRFRLQALQKQNKLNVLSTPMILASNNKEAEIFIGEERVMTTGYSYVSATYNNGTLVSSSRILPTTETRKIGQRLQIWPRINSDGTVTLDIEHENSSLIPQSTTIPGFSSGNTEFTIDSISTASLNLTVIAKNNHTVAVGGMIREQYSTEEQKVPLLGSIPILGKLFSKSSKVKEKTELILLIKPHIFKSADDVNTMVTESLSDHPYFSDGDGAIQNAPESWEPISDDELIDLTRYAAQWITTGGIRVEKLSGVQEAILPIEGSVSWQLANGLTARAERSWSKGNIYVTAVAVTNSLSNPRELLPELFKTGWSAVTFPEGRLVGGHAVNHVYLVSRKPFLEVRKKHFSTEILSSQVSYDSHSRSTLR